MAASHPVRVRGLKPREDEAKFSQAMLSHPVRVRGLKPRIGQDMMGSVGSSHPVRVRGLKRLIIGCHLSGDFVAPRAGAWIETLLATYPDPEKKVAPRAGAWIETLLCLPTESKQ